MKCENCERASEKIRDVARNYGFQNWPPLEFVDWLHQQLQLRERELSKLHEEIAGFKR